MADVLTIALERRTKLQEESKKLDDFISMAEALLGTEGQGNAAASSEAAFASVQ